MRKLFLIVLVVASLLVSCCYADEIVASIDFALYQDDELISMLEDIYAVLQDRNIQKAALVNEGTYICGKDFPAGGYDIFVPDDSESERVGINVYSAKCVDMIATTGAYVYPDLVLDKFARKGEPYHVNLSDGDKLELDERALLVIANPIIFK